MSQDFWRSTVSPPRMSRSRCDELLKEFRQDLNYARVIGDKASERTQEARLQALEDLRARFRGPAADAPQIVEAAA